MQIRIKQISSSLLGLLCTAGLQLVSAQAEKVADPGSEGFLGAELYANVDSAGNGSLNLTKILKCSSPSTNIEKVSFFEREISRLNAIYELKLDSARNYTGAPLGCATSINTCYTIYYYSASLKLGSNWNIYQATWGYCCFGRGFANLDENKKQGITLSVEFEVSVNRTKNRAPFLSSVNHVYLCSNANSGITLNTKDKDSTDRVSIEFSSISSLEPVNGEYFRYQPETGNTAREVMKDISQYNGSVMAGKPPYTPLVYKAGFKAENPAADKIKIDPVTNRIEGLHPAKGKYMLGLTMSDSRNDKVLSRHSLVLIIQVY